MTPAPANPAAIDLIDRLRLHSTEAAEPRLSAEEVDGLMAEAAAAVEALRARVEELEKQHTQDMKDAFQNGEDTKWVWNLKAAAEARVAELERGIAVLTKLNVRE